MLYRAGVSGATYQPIRGRMHASLVHGGVLGAAELHTTHVIQRQRRRSRGGRTLGPTTDELLWAMAGPSSESDTLDWDTIVAQTHSPPATSLETQQRPWEVDERDVTEFGGFSLDDDVDVVACEACQKPVLREAYTFHQGMWHLAHPRQLRHGAGHGRRPCLTQPASGRAARIWREPGATSAPSAAQKYGWWEKEPWTDRFGSPVRCHQQQGLAVLALLDVQVA